MYKKVALAIVILLLVAGVSIYFLRSGTTKTTTPAGSLKSIPINAVLILESNNTIESLNLLINQNEVFRDISKSLTFAGSSRTLDKYDSLIQSNRKIKQYFKNKRANISVHPRGINQTGILFSFECTNASEKDSVVAILNSFKQDSITIKNYDGAIISQLHINSVNYNYSLYKNCFVLSEHITLIENAIRQINSNLSLLNNPVFKSVYETKGKKGAGNLFLNAEQLSSLTKSFLNSEAIAYINQLEGFCQWIALDLENTGNSIAAKGFSAVNDSLKSYLSIFKTQEPVSIELLNSIPDYCSNFIFMGISEHQKFRQSYRKYLAAHNNLVANHNYFLSLKKQTNVNTEKVIGEELSDQLALISIDEDIDKTTNYYTIVKLKNAENFITICSSLVDSLKKSRETSPPTTMNIDTINPFPFPEFFNYYFGPPFNKTGASYFVIINEDYAVFASSRDQLKTYKAAISSGETIENTYYYKNYFSKKYNTACNLLAYYSPAFLSDVLNNGLAPDHQQASNDVKKYIREFYPFSVQFSNSEKMIYTYFSVGLKDSLSQTLDEEWKLLFDTTITQSPIAVYNHSEKREDLFLQDDANIIYWLNSTGEIAWQKKLNEKIVGTPIQVDLFKNNKFQLLFATKSFIHVIDKNGNYLKNYPLKIKNNISSNIAAKSGKKYTTIYFATDDNKLQSYKLTSISADKGTTTNIGFEAKKLITQTTPDGKTIVFAYNNKKIAYQLNNETSVVFDISDSITTPVLISETKDNLYQFNFLDASQNYYSVLTNGKVKTTHNSLISDAKYFIAENNEWITLSNKTIARVNLSFELSGQVKIANAPENSILKKKLNLPNDTIYFITNYQKTALYRGSPLHFPKPQFANGETICHLKSLDNSYKLLTLQKNRKIAAFKIEE